MEPLKTERHASKVEWRQGWFGFCGALSQNFMMGSSFTALKEAKRATRPRCPISFGADGNKIYPGCPDPLGFVQSPVG